MSSDTVSDTTSQKQADPHVTRVDVNGRSLAAISGVALAAALGMASVLASDEPGPTLGTITISTISARDVDQAVTTLDPAVAAGLAAEARACRAPLAFVTVAGSGPDQNSNSIVRIRSGNYLSPPFLLTPAPQRVAVPFPAPYQSGQGTISLEGNARGVAAHLAPVWRTDYLAGRATINVRWQPKPSC